MPQQRGKGQRDTGLHRRANAHHRKMAQSYQAGTWGSTMSMKSMPERATKSMSSVHGSLQPSLATMLRSFEPWLCHAWLTPFWLCCNRPRRCLHYPMLKLHMVPMHRTEPHIVLKCWWLPVAYLLRKVLDPSRNCDVLQTACVAPTPAGKLQLTRLRMHDANDGPEMGSVETGVSAIF